MTPLDSNNPQQDKWNRIYQKKGHLEPQPCPLLSDYRYLLPSSGQALDLACGQGGNAILMANHGLNTQAWDISDVAITQLIAKHYNNLAPLVFNIETAPLPINTFDVIVVSNYLHRPLCQNIIQALTPGGLLFYQTFHQNKLSTQGPSNKNFLLENNELLSLFSDLTPLVYQQLGHQGNISIGDRNQACLIAQKSS